MFCGEKARLPRCDVSFLPYITQSMCLNSDTPKYANHTLTSVANVFLKLCTGRRLDKMKTIETPTLQTCHQF